MEVKLVVDFEEAYFFGGVGEGEREGGEKIKRGKSFGVGE